MRSICRHCGKRISKHPLDSADLWRHRHEAEPTYRYCKTAATGRSGDRRIAFPAEPIPEGVLVVTSNERL